MSLIAIFIAVLFLHSLVSARLERTVFTAPIVFTTAGMLAVMVKPELPGYESAMSMFRRLAEIGLVLLLFSDASRTGLRMLKKIGGLPIRLLSTGMLLTILLGAAAAILVFPKLPLWEAGILAAILAPTDAGLGQIIVNSPRVPMKIRQALNVEAGLNDGLSVPFLLFFIALSGGGEQEDRGLAQFIWEQLGLGTLIGAGIGLIGGWLLGVAHRREWTTHSWQQLGVVALPLLCLLLSDAVHASMFIAAFVAGLAVQIGFKEVAKSGLAFTEDWGQLFNLSVFFLFGLLVAHAWSEFSGIYLLYAVLSLTVVRMLPVAVALIGTRLNRATVLFMGWFGPRGLASIVLGLVYLEAHTHEPHATTIRLAVTMTVLVSVFVHGLSARPGTEWYARKIRSLGSGASELEDAEAEADAWNANLAAQPNH